jgi:hypothetical protein
VVMLSWVSVIGLSHCTDAAGIAEDCGGITEPCVVSPMLAYVASVACWCCEAVTSCAVSLYLSCSAPPWCTVRATG